MIDLFISFAESILAVLMFHRAIPAVLYRGRRSAMTVWALGMTLALFAVGRLESFLYSQTSHPFDTIGHFSLIAFSAGTLHRICRNKTCDWTQAG